MLFENKSAGSLRWLLVGASDIAEKRMFSAISNNPGCRVVGIFSHNLGRAIQFAKQHGIKAFSTIEEGLNLRQADAVYISTKNQHHIQYASLAIERGLHVLCEKPLCLNYGDGFRVTNAARQRGVVLAVNHHLRASAILQDVRHLLECCELGKLLGARVLNVETLPIELRTWRLEAGEPGGGVIWDNTVHVADVVHFVFQKKIETVIAQRLSQSTDLGEVDDGVMGIMCLDDGLCVSFYDSFAVPHASTRLEIFGSDGWVCAEHALAPDPAGILTINRNGLQTTRQVTGPDLYATSVSEFCKAVYQEGVPLASGWDGCHAACVAVAVHESTRLQKQTPVIFAAEDAISPTSFDQDT